MAKGESTCASCREMFSFELIHNGLNDTCYAYCGTCGTCALFDYPYQKPECQPHWQNALPASSELLAFAKRCDCGGIFDANAIPRCPHCFAALSATELTPAIETASFGTSVDWGCQGSWDGPYSFVTNGRLTENPWRKARRPI